MLQCIYEAGMIKDIFQQLVSQPKLVQQQKQESTYSVEEGEQKIEASDMYMKSAQVKDRVEDYFGDKIEPIPISFPDYFETEQNWGTDSGNHRIEDVHQGNQLIENLHQVALEDKLAEGPSGIAKNVSTWKLVLKEKKFEQKNGNTIRFLIDLLIENIHKFESQYGSQVGPSVIKQCSGLRAWHLSCKKNVYNRDHLQMFFGDQHEAQEGSARKTRRFFNTILRHHALQAMMKPRSQIKDKVHYLRVVKIFGLRCRSNKLSQRNQSR